MSNCIDKQENPNQELDNLKDWKEKQIKFEARRKDTLYGLTGDIDVRTQEDLDLLTESDIKRLIKEGKLKVRQKKRGRKGRFQRAAEHTRLSGVDFIFTHFGLSDQYKKEDKWKILKRVLIMARTQIPPRKISRADFDKWWFDPIIDKERPAYYDDPVKQVAYRQ